MRFLTAAVVVTSTTISTTSALSPEDHTFALQEVTVDDLDALPTDECFYDVTIPALLENGFSKYAWVPWSKLSNASLELAPHGAFVYKTTNDTAIYEAIKLVPIDSPDADIVFGTSEPFCTAAKTFEDITSGKVNCSDDEVMNERIRTGLNCWASPMSYTTKEPFVNYNDFAWVSSDALKCGEYVYQLKDGMGLVQHSCDGPETNAQNDTVTNMDGTLVEAPTSTPGTDNQIRDGASDPTSNSVMISQAVLVTAVVLAGATLIV